MYFEPFHANRSPKHGQNSKRCVNSKDKKNLASRRFYYSSEYIIKINEMKNITNHLDILRELKKTAEHKGDSGTNFSCWAWNGLWKDTEGIGNQRKKRHHLQNSIVNIGRNTEKILGD